MHEDVTTAIPVLIDLRHDTPVPVSFIDAPVVLCLGNFDGVHRAHASLLHRTRTLRDEKLPQGLCGVFTFFHPSSDYLRDQGASTTVPGRVTLRRPDLQRHLTTLKEKLRLFKEEGMDFVGLCDFKKICTLSPEAFLAFLTRRLDVRGVACGYNFRFGAYGKGSADTLAAHFDHPTEGLYCVVVPPFCLDEEPVSSTRIRALLTQGYAETAARHLGHPYVLERKVVKGKQLGRKLGFPTANQYFLPESLVPAHGVYAVICHTPLGIFPGVANVGEHPTVDKNAAVNCETHVIGPHQDLYGYPMRVEFLYRLRDEAKFPSVEALTEAIAKDAELAVKYVQAYLKSQ
ncbi:MAG: riboflavin biosynthesis protein RibF [Clostridia bacterium]|nr:riboflavin biosynthesis protein RibF [Clostridia bacterium]